MKFIGFNIMFDKLTAQYAMQFYNKEKHVINSYFIQISLIDMWKYPHKEKRFNNDSWLCGWGFFYFGNIIVRGK